MIRHSRIRIGVSGWSYSGWRGTFYPSGLPRRAELEYVAGLLDSVELNATFYSLQRPSSFKTWYAATPDDFVFAVKGSRFITHMKRLRDCRGALANLFASGVLALDEKLGPVVWQLPETSEFDADTLDDFLTQLPRTRRTAAGLAAEHDDRVASDRAITSAATDGPIEYALEFRNESYSDARVRDLLEAHGIGRVIADTAGRWPMFDEVATGVVYVRLHGEQSLYGGSYHDRSIERWATRCRGWAADGRSVYVYFDNDADVGAPFDALRLQRALAQA